MLILSQRQTYRGACALLLGGFDGLHRGHATLLDAARETGLAVGLTSISGGKAGGELFTRTERRHIFEVTGIDFLIESSFTARFRATPAEEFLASLFARVSARVVFCGEDFRFGRGAEGTPALLSALAPCPVRVMPLLRAGGEKVSSSHIKSLLSAGEPAAANELLLHPYFLGGRVEHGRHVGGSVLGFPTVNLPVAPGKALPKEGVYAGRAETPAGTYPAVVNIGARPTFGVEEKKVEAFLEGFSGDLYGADVRIYPERYLRPVMAFRNAEELRARLVRDREEACKLTHTR